MNHPTLLYDGSCSLCVQLAEFVRRRCEGQLLVQPWQEWKDPSLSEEIPQNIGFHDGQELTIGIQAWERLIELHPDLKGLGWLAEKMGLKTVLASAVSTAAHLTRRLCGSCRLPWYLRG